MDILLANPRGFCAGVDRAISIVELALQQFGAPIYVRHEVVHNKFVVDGLERLGAVFVDELAQVPAGSIVVFSAHGVSRAVRAEAETRGLRVFDATCPLVAKVHTEARRYAAEGYTVLRAASGPEALELARQGLALSRTLGPACLALYVPRRCGSLSACRTAVRSMSSRSGTRGSTIRSTI